MPDPVTISFESKCVSYISCVHKDPARGIVRRAPCTGFFWRNDGMPYLVTNRHCVTGKNSQNLLFSEQGFEPTHLQVYFNQRGKSLGDAVTEYHWKGIEISLFSDGAPQWFEHPHGSLIDIVAVALDEPEYLSVDCVNDRKVYDSWKPEVGADCYIVGYPEGLSGAEATPIWKRASIATEPEMDYKGQEVFLCDSATRPGLSGGPVFGKAHVFSTQGLERIDPYAEGVQFLGSWPVFLGVYAGREGNESDGFQLARVWKRQVLAELFDQLQKAASPFKINDLGH